MYTTLRKQMTKQNLIILLLSGIIPSIALSQQLERDTIKLFFLGGQSNMEGHGKNAELPDAFKKEYENVWIFQGNPVPDEHATGGLGKWAVLTPGHGAGFSSDGKVNKLSHKFGPELSFAKKLQELYPNEKIALIKYSRGGSSLDSLAARDYGSWEMDYRGTNGINQFDHYLTTIKEAFKTKDIDQNGKEDLLIPCGIIWMQGESDATITEAIAHQYYSNLKRLMDLIRASLHQDDLAVVIGKISDSGQTNDGKVWPFGEIVQYAQERYVRTDQKAAIVRDTKYYNYSDPWHYDSEGYLDLGEKFAEAVYWLNEQ
jgi:hypothetical protein